MPPDKNIIKEIVIIAPGMIIILKVFYKELQTKIICANMKVKS